MQLLRIAGLSSEATAIDVEAHDESELPVELRLSPASNGLDEQRSQRQQRMQLLVEQIADYAIFMLDPNGNVMSWNVGAERCLGYSTQEIVGEHFSCLYPQEDRRAGVPALHLRAAEAAGRHEDEGWRIRKGGERVWIDVVRTALRDERRQLIGFATIARDLSERHRLEAEREQTARRREIFLAMVGHDLQGPLSAISVAAHLLRREQAEPQQAALADRVASSALRMSRMVQQLLDVTRARLGGGIPLEMKPTKLREVCWTVMAELNIAHPNRRIRFLATDDCDGFWDGDRLAQVVSNLLENALRYSPEDGVVDLEIESHSDWVRLQVRNPGPPIPEELLPFVFDPFRRGPPSTTSRTRRQGLGLGLYIAHEIVGAHGGAIEARSNERDGTCFVVRLPARER